MAISEDVELGQLGLAEASAEAEARVYQLDRNQVKGAPYLTTWEAAAAAPCLPLEDN